MYEIKLYSQGDCSNGDLLKDLILDENEGLLPNEDSFFSTTTCLVEEYRLAIRRCEDIIEYINWLEDHYDELYEYYGHLMKGEEE